MFSGRLCEYYRVLFTVLCDIFSCIGVVGGRPRGTLTGGVKGQATGAAIVGVALFFPVLTGAANPSFAGRLVTGDDYPPFTGKSLPNHGLASDIVTRAFKLMQLPVELDFRPWKRGYADTLNGTYLGTFPYGRNEEREKHFHYSEPLYRFGQYFFTLANSGIVYESEKDLQGTRICLPQGYNPTVLQQFVDNGTVKLVRPSTMDACFRMLLKKRADIVRVNNFVGWSLVDSVLGQRDNIRMLPKPVRESIEHFIVPRNQEDGEALIRDFNLALQQLRDDGVIDTAIAEHLQ